MKKKKLLWLTAAVIALIVLAFLSADRGWLMKKGDGLILTHASGASRQPLEGGDGWQMVASSGGVKLFVDASTAAFYVEAPDGSTWHAIPERAARDRIARGVYKTELQSALVIEYFDLERNASEKKNTQAACVKDGNFTLHAIDNGFCCVYRFEDAGIAVPLEITLVDGVLRAHIPVGDITEDKPNQYLLSQIRLLPNFGAADTGESGYALLPDGQGAIMRFDSGKWNYDDYYAPLYGENASLTRFFSQTVHQTANLPVFGMKRGDSAFLAIIRDGDASCALNAWTNLRYTSYANAFATFILRTNDAYLLNWESGNAQKVQLYQDKAPEISACTVEYRFLTGDAADYNGMAACYRDDLLAHGAAECTAHADVLLNYTMSVMKKTPLLGIPVNRARVVSTFEGVTADVDALLASGVTPAVRIAEWSCDQMAGKLDVRGKIQRGVGSKAELAELSRRLMDADSLLALTVDAVTFDNDGSGVSAMTDAAAALSGSPAYQYDYAMGTRMRDMDVQRSLVKPDRLLWTANRALDGLNGLEFGAVSPNLVGSVRYGSFSGDVTPPEMTQQAMTRVLDEINQAHALMTDSAAAYAAIRSEITVNAPLSGSGYLVLDECVPFMQMALGGLTTLATTPVNLAANPDALLLDALATGVIPHYSLVTGDEQLLIDTEWNTLFSAQSAWWLPQIASHMDMTAQVRKALSGKRLTAFRWIEDGVSESVFGGETVLYVNRNTVEAVVDGLTIPPMGFTMKEVTAR